MSQKKSTTRKSKCKTYTEQVRAIDRRIDRAEENNVLDMTLAAKQLNISALAVWDAIHAGTPDFIIAALINALDAAAQSQNLSLPMFADDETETKEEAIKKIEDILCLAREYKSAEPDSPGALAIHIAAVMRHPLVPTDLYNAMADALADLESCVDHKSPEYFERALVAYHAGEVRANG